MRKVLYKVEKYTLKCCVNTGGGYMDKKIIILRIDELMQEKGINKYQLKENAEVSSTIYQWRKNAARDKDRTPSLRSIEKICDFLGVTLAYFFSFSNAEQNNTRILEIANSLCDMSKEQLKVLELIIKQFKKTQKDSSL